MPPVHVVVVATESGDFHLGLAVPDNHDPEVGAHLQRSGKQLSHLIRPGVSSNVIVLRGNLEQKIPDAASHEVGPMPTCSKSLDDLARALVWSNRHLTYDRKIAKGSCTPLLNSNLPSRSTSTAKVV